MIYVNCKFYYVIYYCVHVNFIMDDNKINLYQKFFDKNTIFEQF